MDTSEKYIKMCEKAQEIQEYYQNQHIVDVMLRDFVYVKSINFYDSVCVKYERSSGFWIPRQDQLQEMTYNSDSVRSMEVMTFNRFNYFVMSDWLRFDSLEKYWLTFVMKEKYNKLWNEEKQDWIQQ